MMQAQTAIMTPAGEYYLRGVMETACGFKLNEDSTFQFFFSYGALDRFGEGTWEVKNGGIVFNSRPKPSQDFALVQSKTEGNNEITIQFVDTHQAMLRHMYCKIKGDSGEQEGITDSNGAIQFKMQPIDTIEITFEFCPEKKSLFQVQDKMHHFFEFKPQPWLMEVFFEDFYLSLTDEGLAGGHPFSPEKTFRYEKSAH